MAYPKKPPLYRFGDPVDHNAPLRRKLHPFVKSISGLRRLVLVFPKLCHLIEHP